MFARARDRQPLKKNVTNSLRIHVFLIICVFLFFCFRLTVVDEALACLLWWFSSWCLSVRLLIFSSSFLFLSFSFLPVPFETCCQLIATQQNQEHTRYRVISCYLYLSYFLYSHHIRMLFERCVFNLNLNILFVTITFFPTHFCCSQWNLCDSACFHVFKHKLCKFLHQQQFNNYTNRFGIFCLLFCRFL